MLVFYKWMIVSSHLFLAISIFIAGYKATKLDLVDKITWFFCDVYAIALIYTVIKILEGTP